MDVRNLKDLHLKHYHMSFCTVLRREQITWTFQERFVIFTSMWWRRANSASRQCQDLTDHVWADEEQKNLEVSSCWTTDRQKFGDKTFGFLIVLDGATSHLTAYPCKSTSPSEVISKWTLSTWIRQRWRAVMGFHHPHDMQAFPSNAQFEKVSDRTACAMAKLSWDGCTIVQEVSLSTRGYRLQKSGPDYSVTDHSGQVDAQCSNGEKYPGNSEWQKRPMELAMGRRPRDLMDPASMNPEQLTSTPTKQDLLNEEIQKLANEIQQRQDIRRDLAENAWSLFLLIFEKEKVCFTGKKIQQNPSRTEIWQMVEGGDYCCQGYPGSYQYWCVLFFRWM